MTAERDDLYAAFEAVFGAQRRLRGRDARLVDGVSLAQSRLLRLLAREGAMPVGRLAGELGVTAAAATQMLDGLQARGLLERQRLGEDRRVITIALTDVGRARAQESREHHRRLFEAALGGLSDAELRIGADVLRRCTAYLNSL